MKTQHYIAQLLYRYQCVTVPGFGAFLTEVLPARIDAVSNSFYPPKKVVSFNSFIKNNDGLLANHVALQEKISYETALQNIQKEVSLWKGALQNGQPLQLQNIGSLSLNYEGGLVFETSGNINYHTGSFGLNSFVSPAVQRENLAAAEENIADEPPVITLVPEVKRSYGYLKYAAIFVVGLGAAGFFGNRYHEQQIIAQTQLVQAEVQKDVQQRIQEATFFIQGPLPKVTLSVKEEKLPYHIVAGAFREESNAQRIFIKLSDAGFKAKRLDKNRFGLFPVLYGSYATYPEAQQALAEIHKTQSPEAWLMIDKN